MVIAKRMGERVYVKSDSKRGRPREKASCFSSQSSEVISRLIGTTNYVDEHYGGGTACHPSLQLFIPAQSKYESVCVKAASSICFLKGSGYTFAL